MSTQIITIDSAPYISFAGPEAAGPTNAEALSDMNRLQDSDFFKGKSVSELAREQGVRPIKDIRAFAGVIPDDDDADEMLAEIYRLREP
jgi:hypothetical protein